MSLQIKAKILEMVYDKENNLFRLLLEDADNKKQTQVAIKGTDWGITPDVPDNIVQDFCKDMKGKEKIIHIETEQASLRDAKKDENGIVSQEEINNTYDKLSNYPIDEVMNVLHKDDKKDES